MSVRKLLEERKSQRIVDRDLPVVGKVKIRRVDTDMMLELAKFDKNESSLRMLLGCVLERDGTPVFTSVEEIRQTDWQIVEPLLNAVNEHNGFDKKVEKAAKN